MADDLTVFRKMQEFYEPGKIRPLGDAPVSIPEMFALHQSRYAIWTIVPMAEKPYMQLYVVDADEIKSLFFSLLQCGESVFAIEPVDAATPPSASSLRPLITKAPAAKPPVMMPLQCSRCKKWTVVQNVERRPVPDILPLLEKEGWRLIGEELVCPCA